MLHLGSGFGVRGWGSGKGLGYLPRTLDLSGLKAVPLHLDPLCLRVVTLLRQGHLEGEGEGGVEVRGEV